MRARRQVLGQRPDDAQPAIGAGEEARAVDEQRRVAAARLEVARLAVAQVQEALLNSYVGGHVSPPLAFAAVQAGRGQSISP